MRWRQRGFTKKEDMERCKLKRQVKYLENEQEKKQRVLDR